VKVVVSQRHSRKAVVDFLFCALGRSAKPRPRRPRDELQELFPSPFLFE
jgi:hypothetical protein